MIKDNVVKLYMSTIYVYLDSITTQSISEMTHFFCLNGPLDPKMQNPGENTEGPYIKCFVIYLDFPSAITAKQTNKQTNN